MSKNLRNILLYALVFLVVSSCKLTNERKSNDSFSFPNWELIANKLIERSNLKKGEKVLLISKPGSFDPIISLLEEKINLSGAKYLGTFSVDSLIKPDYWQTDFITKGSEKDKDELIEYLMNVDLGIMLPGANPNHTEYSAMQEVLKKHQGRTIHFHWAGAYDLSGNLLDVNDEISNYYQDVLLKTDYNELSKRQRIFENALRENLIKVTTPLGTDIKFRVGNRPVTKQDGDASYKKETYKNLIDREIELPPGAIRVAPIEETVEGTIAFPNSVWQGEKVEGLVITFKKGKIENLFADKGEKAVLEELKLAGEAGQYFREFALGFNPLLSIPEKDPWIPYYGYGAGVIRLSLGDNTELGGKVTGGYVRWNFFTDATVIVGEDLWVKNGKLVK